MKTRPTKTIRSHRLCVTLPLPLHKKLLEISNKGLQTKSLAGLVLEAVIEKYGKKIQ